MKKLIRFLSLLCALLVLQVDVIPRFHVSTSALRLLAQERWANNPTTTLLGDITNSATSITVNSASGFPSTKQFHILIDGEIMLVTSVSGTTWTVTRGYETSTAATHNDGAITRLIFTADVIRNMQDYTLNQGRVTTESGVCVSTSDRTSQSTIYWTPCGRGGLIGAYVSTNEWVLEAPGELSLALSGLTSAKQYDVFMTCAASCTLELSAAWNSDSTRFSSGTYAVNLPTQNGVYVKSTDGTVIDATRRYLGTIRTTATTTTEDSVTKRFVWNGYNQVAQRLSVSSSTQHNYSGGGRAWNNSTSIRYEWVQGIANAAMSHAVLAEIGGGTSAYVGSGMDSTTSTTLTSISNSSDGTNIQNAGIGFVAAPLGYHYGQAIEFTGAGTGTFYSVTVSAIFIG